MFIDKHREVVFSSPMNIPQRIKAIDKDYFVVRNHSIGKFEVHHKGQIDGTLALTIPYDELDFRTIQMVKETRIEYIDKIIKEMDENNRKLEEKSKKKVSEYTDMVCRDIHSYVNKHESKTTADLSDSRLYKDLN